MNAPSREAAQEPPLVVDLDGTLLRGDLLQESALRLLATAPLQVPTIRACIVRCNC